MKQLGYVLIALMTLSFAAVAAATPSGSVHQVVIPYFLEREGFTTELLLHNQRRDRAVGVSIYLQSGGARRLWTTTTLQAKETRIVPLGGNHSFEKPIGYGAIVVEYVDDVNAVDASAKIIHRRDRLVLGVSGIRPDFVFGTRHAAVLWRPDESTSGLLAIVNTTSGERQVDIDGFSERGRASVVSVRLSPFELQLLNITVAIRRAGVDAPSRITGLEMSHDGAAADVLIGGNLLNHGNGFSSRIAFTDLSHNVHDRVARAQFALFGTPPSGFGFEADTSFTPVCALYNAGTEPIEIKPVLKSKDGAATRVVPLPAVTLGAHGTSQLNFTSVPANIRHAALELPWSGAGRLIANLTDLDQSSGYRYNPGSSMTGHLFQAVEADFWSVTDEANTVIAITNAAAFEDVFRIELRRGSTVESIPPVRLRSGEFVAIDLREAIAAPGQGSLTVRGDRGLTSSFYFEELVVNAAPSLAIEPEEEMSDIDGGSEVRVVSIEGDAAEPSHDESAPSATPLSVSFPILIYVHWSDGHTGSDAGAQVGTTPNPHLSWDNATWRATANIDGSEWDDALFISYIDPCSYYMSFSAVVTFAIRFSAYEYSGMTPGLLFDQCLWRSTCTGSCSTPGYVTVKAHGPEPCFDPGAPYVQCSDLLVNGATCWRKLFCPNVPVPGYCN